MKGIDAYYAAIQSLQQQVIESQRPVLEAVSQSMADTISADKRLFLFGTGHSHMMVEEGFYRAGGLACVVPVFSGALMLHDNARLSGFLERSSGMAPILLEPLNPQPGEMIFVYSNSGVNHLPVEMALFAAKIGLKVVAVCSKNYARVAPLSSLGKRLFEVADFELDNGGFPGDALIPVTGTPWKVSPSSTVINAMLWNCLVTETVFILQERGIPLPIIASLNMAGAAEHNQAVLDKWRKVNPYL
ncbi:MAG: SIS domain-containing protein [Anaerolineae bacterium]|nr:SIS domain-containing protein [Anaerolineae bacterium]